MLRITDYLGLNVCVGLDWLGHLCVLDFQDVALLELVVLILFVPHVMGVVYQDLDYLDGVHVGIT